MEAWAGQEQPVTADEFRATALGMPGATEGEHMGHPDFRAGGRIFATLTGDGERAMVKVTPEVQAELVEGAPGAFEAAKGAWGRAGATMVRLKGAKKSVVKGAVAAAWRLVQENASKRKR
jgi:hypothetical protein